MTSKLIPFKTPIALGTLQPDGSVRMSPEFQRWLNRDVVVRVGGTEAMTNLELAKAVTELEGDLDAFVSDLSSPAGANRVGADFGHTYAAGTVFGPLKLNDQSFEVARTMQARFNDVYDLDEVLDGGGLVANDAKFSAFLTWLATRPDIKTLRSRKGRMYLLNSAGYTLPAGIKLRMEGAQFLFSGAIAGASHILTLGTGTDFDALRVEIASGSTLRRAIQLNGGHRGGLVECIADAQIDNYGGSNLDAAVRVLGQGNRIDEVKVANLDKALIVYGEGADASATQVDTRIGFIDISSYVTGLYARNLTKFQVGGYNIRNRSVNATDNPGNNGILTAGVVDSLFGPGFVGHSGEHGIRVGGSNGTEIGTNGVDFVSPTTYRSGESGFKVWSGANTDIIYDISVTGGSFIDCGDIGTPGFNDFGMMVQNVTNGQFTGNKVITRSNSVSAYDGVYISQASNVDFDGLQVVDPSRNGVTISEFNGNGSDANSSFTVNIRGLVVQGHVTTGVWVDTTSTDMHDIMIPDAHIIGGVDPVKWTAGAGAHAAHQCYFAVAARGYSGTLFNVPATANIKTVDLLSL